MNNNQMTCLLTKARYLMGASLRHITPAIRTLLFDMRLASSLMARNQRTFGS
jgi:hypothetical protein